MIERANITSWLLPFSLHSEELYARIISQRRIFLRRESGILMRSLLAPIGESCPLPAHKSARVCRIHNFLTFIAFSFSLSHIHARTHTLVSLTRVTRLDDSIRKNDPSVFHVSINAVRYLHFRSGNFISPSFF